jgi:hypothetical protein|tara:strand:- start:171 stop:539 length:369 start_codon:yes stop_codon:yes gene_type:complete
MIRVPKEVHKALGTLLKYKLINEQDMSVFIEKYMKKDASLRVVQLVQPRDATVDLKRKALDTITSKATMALTFAETLELLTKNHGTAHTENALRYVMNLLVQEGKLEQTNVDGRVLYARKDK